MKYSALNISVLEYSAYDIVLQEIFCNGIFYFPQELLAFQWLQYPPYRWTFLHCDIICISGMEYSAYDIALQEIFCDGIFSFPRELLAFQWLQYPPYRWTFLQCKAFPLSPRLLSQQTTPTINKQLQPKINKQLFTAT